MAAWGDAESKRMETRRTADARIAQANAERMGEAMITSV
jgi:hypothetical protein